MSNFDQKIPPIFKRKKFLRAQFLVILPPKTPQKISGITQIYSYIVIFCNFSSIFFSKFQHDFWWSKIQEKSARPLPPLAVHIDPLKKIDIFFFSKINFSSVNRKKKKCKKSHFFFRHFFFGTSRSLYIRKKIFDFSKIFKNFQKSGFLHF